VNLPNGPYRVIYADPPWQYRDKCHAGKRGAGYKYRCLTVAEICALPVRTIAAPSCLLALWWTGPMIREALAVVDAWGFTLKNATGFTWVKTTRSGRHAFGMGHLTRGNAENCLFATLGKPARVSAAVSQLIVAPVREHSRKPDEARTALERLMGDVPRVELFARQRVPGWDAWGDELEDVVA
jgi:N6-adenosine-specific RNA methylase IME4